VRIQADVSVIIPTYNRKDTLCRSVDSSLNQPSCNVEVIVVDDGSTDKTEKILREYYGERIIEDGESSEDDPGKIVYQRNKSNQGVSYARNMGLSMSRGQYVKFLDSDDELVPNTLHKEISTARKTGADVVVTGYRIVNYDEKGRRVSSRNVPAPEMDRGIDDMLLGRAPWTSAALYRRKTAESVRWKPSYGKADDWGWAWDICLSGAKFKKLEIISSVYNQYYIQRITGGRNSFEESTSVRQYILRHVEKSLSEKGILTEQRKNALAQYYYKDAKIICEMDVREWEKIWRHCSHLVPNFTPEDSDKISKVLIKLFGTFCGIVIFVRLRKVARLFGLKRSA
jgi:glycosyltransferase involved in cell wall biosynthesis